jgi:DNA polymerase-1
MIGFNLKEKIKELKRAKKNLPYGGTAEIFDLGVAFWLINPDEENYTGEYLALKYLHKEFNPSAGSGQANSEEILYELKEYAENKLKEFGMEKLFYEIEMPLLLVLVDMEMNGIGLNKKKLRDLDVAVSKKLLELTRNIYKEAGFSFNINSPKQLGEILFKKLTINSSIGAKIKKTPGGAISTNFETLMALKGEHKIIDLILEYRELFKLQSTYIKPFQELIAKDGRIHTTYLQTGTVTGRLSSENPNMQNIPAGNKAADEFKNCFESAKGYSFVSFDYSQIELRVLASLSGDPKMIEAFNNDLDIHKITAAQVNNVPLDKVTPQMRQFAKTLNFGMVYGIGFISFARSSGLSAAEAKKFIAEYFDDFKQIKKWQEKVKEEARKNCFVSNLNGRRRWLLNIVSSSQFLAKQAEREAINMPVQSLAADILKIAMIKIYEDLNRRGWWNNKVRLLLTIHDELLFEIKDDIIKEAVKVISNLMETAFKLSVPIKVSVEIGKTWNKMS